MATRIDTVQARDRRERRKSFGQRRKEAPRSSGEKALDPAGLARRGTAAGVHFTQRLPGGGIAIGARQEATRGVDLLDRLDQQYLAQEGIVHFRAARHVGDRSYRTHG